MTATLEGGEWSAARPGRTLPTGKDPVPIVQEAGWAAGLLSDITSNFHSLRQFKEVPWIKPPTPPFSCYALPASHQH